MNLNLYATTPSGAGVLDQSGNMVLTVPVQWTPGPKGELYSCHYYIPGDSYDRCDLLKLAEIEALAPTARFHSLPHLDVG